MATFRIALTGDYLNPDGSVAYGDIGLSRLDAEPNVCYHFLTEQAPQPGDAGYWDRFYGLAMTPEQIREVDGLVVVRPWVRRSLFSEGADTLTVIGRSGAGYDKIDLAACTENDVAVFNAPMALNHSTASSALLFMLALSKRLSEQDRLVREGRWDRQSQVMGSEIQGRVLGIVGLGRSGRELTRLVAPFEMDVIAYSPHADPEQARRLGVRLVSLDELMSTADFVSLHCHLTRETRGRVGVAELSRMKPGAYFINVARGEVVDQEALTQALAERRIAGAGLDVFEPEPLPADHPLAKLDNVILSPHWSASTTDVWQATGRAMIDGMLRASRGEVPKNVLNHEVLEREGFRRKLGRFCTG